MFRPNTYCYVYQRSDEQDAYAQFTYSQPIKTPCSVTQMDLKVAKTSVRADSSASRGRAEEEIGMARLLFLPNAVLREGDIVTIDGNALEVMRIFQRHDVNGKVDHLQVDLRKGMFPNV